MTDTIRVANDGHVRTITMNRPERKNALNQEMAWSIVAAVEEAARDDSVWVIGITGTGNAFCSGLDLKEMGDYTPLSPMSQQLDDIAWIGRFPLVLRQVCEKPVVAGINGVAVGGGLSLALSADIRIMARGARILAGYPRIGASPDGGMTWTLPQLIGYEQAMRFLLENRDVDGDEAFRLGLVGEVVDDAQFASRFHDYCQSLTRLSPITARLTKRCLVKATEIDLESLLRLEIASITKAFASQDGIEARRAFLEKRTPAFAGR